MIVPDVNLLLYSYNLRPEEPTSRMNVGQWLTRGPSPALV